MLPYLKFFKVKIWLSDRMNVEYMYEAPTAYSIGRQGKPKFVDRGNSSYLVRKV
jgi:hypothetical protein